MGKPGIQFPSHQQPARQRDSAARVRFSPELRKTPQSESNYSERDPVYSATATQSSGNVSCPKDVANASVLLSNNPGLSTRKHPQPSGTPKSAPATLAGGEYGRFILSPHAYMRPNLAQGPNLQNRLSRHQYTDAGFSLLIRSRATPLQTLPTPRSHNLFRMDFLGTYFSRTPRGDADKATTPGFRRHDEWVTGGSAYWQTRGDNDVEDLQQVDEPSPTSVLCEKLRNVRKCDARKCSGSPAPDSETGLKVAVGAAGVHFLAPCTDDIDSLQTIKLTPKGPSNYQGAPSFSPTSNDSSKRNNKGFIIRRTSCESASSFGTKKDKGFNLFGFRITREGAPP